MSDEYKPLHDELRGQLDDPDPLRRAAARLLNGAVDSAIEFKTLIGGSADDQEKAADLAIALVDAMALVMASLVSYLSEESGKALLERLGESTAGAIRARAKMPERTH